MIARAGPRRGLTLLGMKLLLVVALAVVRVAPAHACGVPRFGEDMAAVAQALVGAEEDFDSPLLVLGAGTSSDSSARSIAVGWGWGKRQVGGMFPGSSLSRVMFELRQSDHRSFAATYGWYGNHLASLGFDGGISASAAGVGPTARLTLGLHGIGVQLAAGVEFGPAPRPYGAAELVVDVLDLTGQL